MSCDCYKIGGPFIAEDPDCPLHGCEGYEKKIEKAEEKIAQLTAENTELRQELEGWWEEAHDDACTNMKDCASYGGEKRCYRPRPEILGDRT